MGAGGHGCRRARGAYVPGVHAHTHKGARAQGCRRAERCTHHICAPAAVGFAVGGAVANAIAGTVGDAVADAVAGVAGGGVGDAVAGALDGTVGDAVCGFICAVANNGARLVPLGTSATAASFAALPGALPVALATDVGRQRADGAVACRALPGRPLLLRHGDRREWRTRPHITARPHVHCHPRLQLHQSVATRVRFRRGCQLQCAHLALYLRRPQAAGRRWRVAGGA
eukprot:365584-Chlamydomonas_euryale.AAC.10